MNPELAEDAPYVIAFVELDEGVRMFTNVVGLAADAVAVGMRVRSRFEASLDGAVRVPVFEPDTA